MFKKSFSNYLNHVFLHGPLTLLVVVHLPIGQVYRNIHWVFPLGTYGNCPWDNALLFASSVKRPGKH